MLYDTISINVKIELKEFTALKDILCMRLDCYGAKLLANMKLKPRKNDITEEEFIVYKLEKPMVSNDVDVYLVALRVFNIDIILSIADNPEEAICNTVARFVVRDAIHIENNAIKVDYDVLKDILYTFCKIRDEVMQKLNAQNKTS